jgi:hypothetical protein
MAVNGKAPCPVACAINFIIFVTVIAKGKVALAYTLNRSKSAVFKSKVMNVGFQIFYCNSSIK